MALIISEAGKAPSDSEKTSQKKGERKCKSTVGVIPHVFIERVSALRVDELVAILSHFTKTTLVITDGYDSARDGLRIIPIKATKRASLLSKVFEQVSIHLQLLRVLFATRNEIELLLFFLGGIEFAIP